MGRPWSTGEGWILLYPSGSDAIGVFPSQRIAENFGVGLWGPKDVRREGAQWKAVKLTPVGAIRWEAPPVFACNPDESGGLADG